MALSPSAGRPFIDKVARWTTLAGVALCPSLSLPLGDALLFLALLLRVVQLVTTGLPLGEIRKHDALLAVFGAVAVGGVLSGIVHSEQVPIVTGGVFQGFVQGGPMPWALARWIIATVGSVLVVATYGTTRASLKELVRALALGGAFLAFTAYFMPSANGRIYGFATHPNLLGHSCIMGFMAAVAAYDWATRRASRVFWAGCMVITAAALFSSGSRGSLLGLWLAMVLYLVLSGRRRLVLFTAAATYLAIVLVAVGLAAVPGDSAVGRLLGDASSKGANVEREERLDYTIDVITHDPVFGAGFVVVILVHNVYLAAWVGGGAIAGLAIILLGLAMLALPFGRPRAVLALPCGAAGIAVAWMLTNIFSTRDQWVFLILAFRLARSAPDPAPSSLETRPDALVADR